jgi:hypothetical protein
MTTIDFNDLVRRQTEGSEFTHWTIPESILLSRVRAAFMDAKPGYRDGVLLVQIDPGGFFSPVVELQEGDVLVGKYKARQEGEEPRKSVQVVRQPANGESVPYPDDIGEWTDAQVAADLHWSTMSSITPPPEKRDAIISEASYRLEHGLPTIVDVPKTPAKQVDVVLYRKDVLAEGNENSTEADWEIVAINGQITKGYVPIMPDTLIANHFELDGGSATGMAPEEFVEALRASVLYWKDKALVAPRSDSD